MKKVAAIYRIGTNDNVRDVVWQRKDGSYLVESDGVYFERGGPMGRDEVVRTLAEATAADPNHTTVYYGSLRCVICDRELEAIAEEYDLTI